MPGFSLWEGIGAEWFELGETGSPDAWFSPCALGEGVQFYEGRGGVGTLGFSEFAPPPPSSAPRFRLKALIPTRPLPHPQLNK